MGSLEAGLEGTAGAWLRRGAEGALLACLALLLLALLWARRKGAPGPKGRPLPGPVGWPLLGNVPQLGRLPHRTFCALAGRFGPVFQLRLGRRRVVVLNGEAAIRRALLQLGGPFAGRPDFPSFGLVSGGKSLAFGSYSARWRAQKKLAQATLRAFSTAQAPGRRLFEQHVAEEALELIAQLIRRSGQGPPCCGGYVDPAPLLTVANANVMCALCFGQRYGHDDAEFRALLGRNDRFGQTVASGSLVDVLPWLQAFPNPVRAVFRDFQALTREMHDFVRGKVAQHRLAFRPGEPPRDMSDAILGSMERQGLLAEEEEEEYVEGTLSDLFGAGQDTTSTGLAWVLLLLLKHPELRGQLQEELDSVVGPGRLPRAEDRPSLPRLEAFLYESLRYSSFVPLTIPHATTSDVALEGFHIPEGTVVFVNQWSVNHDPRRWKEPHRFDPGRFLEGGQPPRLDRERAAQVLLFSLGKRRCIGERLAKLQLFLFAAILLHQCQLQGNPRESLSMDCQHGLVLRPRPFTLALRRRRGKAPPAAP